MNKVILITLAVAWTAKMVGDTRGFSKVNDRMWAAHASLPAGTTAYFINVMSGDLVASSDDQQ